MNPGQFNQIRVGLEQNKKLVKENDELDWYHYDSPLSHLAPTFYEVLPDEYRESFEKSIKEKEIFNVSDFSDIFKKYIENTLKKENNEQLVALEFGGPGSNLFKGFTKGFFDKTMGVCLDDLRVSERKKTDTKSNHFVMIGINYLIKMV